MRRRSNNNNDQSWCGRQRASAGFSLLELIVVIALLAILTGVVGNQLSGEPENARRARAATEVETIAQALRTFHATAGQWPTLDASGRSNTVRVLLSGARLPAANPWQGPHPFWTWTQAGQADLLHNHLVANTPAGQATRRYPPQGVNCWRGPYLETCPLDPWGRPYVANLIATHSAEASNYRRLFVLSAGPDGRLQTSADATSNQTVAGDDIGCLVWQR